MGHSAKLRFTVKKRRNIFRQECRRYGHVMIDPAEAEAGLCSTGCQRGKSTAGGVGGRRMFGCGSKMGPLPPGGLAGARLARVGVM
jgi:hypothetical protein